MYGSGPMGIKLGGPVPGSLALAADARRAEPGPSLPLAALPTGGGVLTAPGADQPLQEILQELKRLNITNNITINNHSEANTTQKTLNMSTPAEPAPVEVQHKDTSFFASPTTRISVFSAIGLALYMLQGHLQHKWRMAEMQRRIDANLFLRLTQILGSAPAPK
mmetsp:Transcript_23024/g.52746  ORF Transcript_23024/g.52746 Transcript_23024/m.52746 type:complete len:164 (-) Transcript_23024:34-525(-)